MMRYSYKALVADNRWFAGARNGVGVLGQRSGYLMSLVFRYKAKCYDTALGQ